MMDSKTPIDLTAATSTGAVLMGMLPEMLTVIATALTIVWFAIRIWELTQCKPFGSGLRQTDAIGYDKRFDRGDDSL